MSLLDTETNDEMAVHGVIVKPFQLTTSKTRKSGIPWLASWLPRVTEAEQGASQKVDEDKIAGDREWHHVKIFSASFSFKTRTSLDMLLEQFVGA